MFRQLVCLVLGTLAIGSQAFMPPTPLVKATPSAAARMIQPENAQTGLRVPVSADVLVSVGDGEK